MIYWIWLSQIPGIGPAGAAKLLSQYSTPQQIYQESALSSFEIKGLHRNQIEAIIANRSLENARKVLDVCERNQIFILNSNMAEYPSSLKQFPLSPVLLYGKGKPDFSKSSVGLVGARRCNQKMKWKTKDLVLEYLRQNRMIISGMAKGIDGYAHTACINYGGFTIAVLGNGIDICYPKEHEKLMQRIAETGLLLSEYPPGTVPKPYYFPQRNRIIAALSDHLIVIGAGKGSGALITADYAKNMGRTVEYIHFQMSGTVNT